MGGDETPISLMIPVNETLQAETLSRENKNTTTCLVNRCGHVIYVMTAISRSTGCKGGMLTIIGRPDGSSYYFHKPIVDQYWRMGPTLTDWRRCMVCSHAASCSRFTLLFHFFVARGTQTVYSDLYSAKVQHSNPLRCFLLKNQIPGGVKTSYSDVRTPWKTTFEFLNWRHWLWILLSLRYFLTSKTPHHKEAFEMFASWSHVAPTLSNISTIPCSSWTTKDTPCRRRKAWAQSQRVERLKVKGERSQNKIVGVKNAPNSCTWSKNCDHWYCFFHQTISVSVALNVLNFHYIGRHWKTWKNKLQNELRGCGWIIWIHGKS